MGASASSDSKLSESDVVAAKLVRETLRGWPLERVLALNRKFRTSGAGFMMEPPAVASLLKIPVEVAAIICRVLSRSMKRDAVNVMTLLAVIQQTTFLPPSPPPMGVL